MNKKSIDVLNNMSLFKELSYEKREEVYNKICDRYGAYPAQQVEKVSTRMMRLRVGELGIDLNSGTVVVIYYDNDIANGSAILDGSLQKILDIINKSLDRYENEDRTKQ